MVAVLVFVCAAVALNWSYNKRWGTPDAEMVAVEDEEMLLANADFAQKVPASAAEYFAEARLTRQVSRDEALQLLSHRGSQLRDVLLDCAGAALGILLAGAVRRIRRGSEGVEDPPV